MPAWMMSHGWIPLFQVFLEQGECGMLVLFKEDLRQGTVGLAEDAGVEILAVVDIGADQLLEQTIAADGCAARG